MESHYQVGVKMYQSFFELFFLLSASLHFSSEIPTVFWQGWYIVISNINTTLQQHVLRLYKFE
jgi:hypothetical protein